LPRFGLWRDFDEPGRRSGVDEHRLSRTFDTGGEFHQWVQRADYRADGANLTAEFATSITFDDRRPLAASRRSVGSGASRAAEESTPQQVEPAPAVHLTLDELDARHLPLRLAV
jgi:hypothetical protein